MPDRTHIDRVRQELPATTSRSYLNTGTFGPLPACAARAMQQHMQRDLQEGRLGQASFDETSKVYNAVRQSVARLLCAYEDEIALTDNTGEGLNIICYGLDWRAGDEIITTNHEHFSMLAPLYQLRARYGVVLRMADLGPEAGRPVLQAVTEQITPRTRLIALSHVTWTTGARLDISEIGTMGRKRGIPVLIDGAQSAGAIPLNVHTLGVDFYAMPGQKWLCGPDGTGTLYASRQALNYVTATYVGYWSTVDTHGADWKLQENARRFEVGGRQTAAIAAQAETLRWLEETVGHSWLFARITELNAHAAHILQTVPGLRLLTPHPGESGLLTFTLDRGTPEEIVMYLREQHNIYIRTISEMQAMRVSTGFYNTEEEIEALARALTVYQPASLPAEPSPGTR
ncbi:MAG TPA: aminotransferase class V-fold PLP-dependent enzyme [Ktedonobacteraceae bacterium]|jgi:L-cysteine/cystine lyase